MHPISCRYLYNCFKEWLYRQCTTVRQERERTEMWQKRGEEIAKRKAERAGTIPILAFPKVETVEVKASILVLP